MDAPRRADERREPSPGVLVLLGSGLAWLARDHVPAGPARDAWFHAAFAASVCAYAVAAAYLARAVLGEPYRELPSASALLRFRETLREREPDGVARSFDAMMERRLVAAASRNQHVNRNRVQLLEACHRAIVVALLAFTAALVPHPSRERTAADPLPSSGATTMDLPRTQPATPVETRNGWPPLEPNVIVGRRWPWEPLTRWDLEDEDDPTLWKAREEVARAEAARRALPWWRRMFVLRP